MTQAHLCEDREVWDETIATLGGHPLQLWGWGEVKLRHHWGVTRVLILQGGHTIGAAQVLTRDIPFVKKKIAYVPRGPVCDEKDRKIVLDSLMTYANTVMKIIGISVEPDWEGESAMPQGWFAMKQTMLIPRTLRLDLTKSIEELQSDIVSKRRYDIRKSMSTVGDSIRIVTDEREVKQCLSVYRETSKRAGFGIHDDDYYLDIFREMGEGSRLVAAYANGMPVAFTWYAVTQAVAFELYGGITEEGQKLRANYGLKWWGIEYFSREGVRVYDFNGLLNDGISSFKKSFASHENNLIGTYGYAFSPLYRIWLDALPVAKHTVQLIDTLRKKQQ